MDKKAEQASQKLSDFHQMMEQEPVGYFAYDEEHDIWEELTGPNAPGATPLYAAPVQQAEQSQLVDASLEPVQIGWQCADCKAPVRDGYTCDVCDSGAAEERYAAPQPVKQEPVATHICNLWVDPVTKEYVVDHCDHPIEELIPAYSIKQYLKKEPDYWLVYGLQAYTQKPFEGATPLYAAPVQQAEQEPVAWRWSESNGERWFDWRTDWTKHDEALRLGFKVEYAYAAPVRTKDLTELLDIMVGMANYIDKLGGDSKKYRAVIAAYKEKNK